MGTVTQAMADEIVSGRWSIDNPVKIVKYKNAFDGSDTFGVVFEGENLNKYRESEYVIEPELYWLKPGMLHIR